VSRDPAPAQQQRSSDDDYTPDPRRWKALAICLVAGSMSLLDVSIVNVALPSIGTGLGAGENALQWVVSGYALAFGLLLVPAGRLGDVRGRRPTFMTGLVLFTAASVLCGLAPSPGLLVVARLLQGAAGGVLIPQVTGLVQELFRGRERATAFGALGTTIGLSTAVGPLLGGAIIAAFGAQSGWRYVFFVNLPVGLVALPLARRLLPAPRARIRGAREDLDPVGVVLLGLAVVCVLLPLIEQQQWHSPLRLVLFPLSAVVLLGWLLWERRYARRHDPVVDLELFRRRSYSLGAGVGLLYFAGFTGIFFTYTQYLQNGLRYSALLAGLAVTPFALGSAAAAAVGGRVVSRYGRALVTAGLAMVVTGLMATYLTAQLVPGRGAGWALALPLLVCGVGSGLVITPNQTLTLSEVPVSRAGSAGGVLQTGQRIGGAGGIAATGSVFFGVVARTRGDWAQAFRHGLVVITALVLAALLLAALDLLSGRRRAHRADVAVHPA